MLPARQQPGAALVLTLCQAAPRPPPQETPQRTSFWMLIKQACHHSGTAALARLAPSAPRSGPGSGDGRGAVLSGLIGAWHPSLPSGAGGGSARQGGTDPDQAWLRIWGGELRTGCAGRVPTSASAEHRWRSSGGARSQVSAWVEWRSGRPLEGGPWAGESGLAERPSTDIGGGFHPGGASPLMGRETTQAAQVVCGPALHSRSRCCAGCWRAMIAPWSLGLWWGSPMGGVATGSIFRELLPFLKITIAGGS